MRITDVHAEVVDAPAGPSYRWRKGIPGSSPAGTRAVIRVMTDSGIDGVAYARRGNVVADIITSRLRDELVGQDPLQREFLWHRVWEVDRIEELPIYALGVLDVALWDLAGTAPGIPVYQLLGGFRASIPAYASTVTFSSVEEYLDVADQCLALGYPAIKLHAWGDAREDARLCAALRAHVGDDVPLMYDGSAGFDLPDAIYLGHALTDARYLWYEEPMREFSINAYRILSENVRVPLLVAETSDGAHMNAADFITQVSPAFVRTSAGFKGGITGAMRIAHLADAFRIRAEVHGGGVVNRHLCMAIANTTYYESLIYSNPVQREPAVGDDGHVQAPTQPGIGYEPA
jgi:L-alanine-DL-glutamate epimerase-like enolase superfamily enzyme